MAIPESDPTMLMFVGENVEVLTIASRREESASRAPAVADVITRKDLNEWGVFTISEALSRMPGFYMAQKEWGTQPYLRGIPDSTLWLYDTIPLSSGLRKSYHPLDYDLSMAGIKRIEIIRGPGSVLWGPDAFAGIVNIVPMSGRDLNGVESGVLYGAPGDRRGFYLNIGHERKIWDYFISLSGYEGELEDTKANIVKFWGEGDNAVDAEDRFGSEWPGDSRFIEAVGKFVYEDWLTVSGRFADNRRTYTMIIAEDDLTWLETRDNPTAFMKLEARKVINPFSGLRFTATYHFMEDEHKIIHQNFTQKEDTLYGEILYDRSFNTGNGLFTGGISYREKHIEDAMVWDGYLPDYLKPDNESLLPLPENVDYNATLWSVFGQYNQRFSDFEAWIGLRYDNHDLYEDRVSMSTGISWSPSREWIYKLLYGTAYRTPHAKQLQDRGTSNPENIRSVNLLVHWKPSSQWTAEICGFWSKVNDHVMEDIYAGLSEPNRQELIGLEVQSHYSPMKNLNFSANLSIIDNSGPDETYFYNDYTIIPPEGPEEPHFIELHYPYDIGAHTLFNLIGTWQATEAFSFSSRLQYLSSRKLIYLRDENFFVASGESGEWLLDIGGNWKNFLYPGLELEITGRNITDRRYETPGTYSAIEGEPMNFMIRLKKKW